MQNSNLTRATLAIALSIFSAAWHVPAVDATPSHLTNQIKRLEVEPKTGRHATRPIHKNKDSWEDTVEAVEAEPEAVRAVYRPCDSGSEGRPLFRDKSMVSATRGGKIETVVIDQETACWNIGFLVTYDGTVASEEIELATGLLEIPARRHLRSGGSFTDGSASSSGGEAGACEVAFARRFKRTPIIITSERRTGAQDRDAATVAVTGIRNDGFGIAVEAEDSVPTAIAWIAIGTPFSEDDPGTVFEAAKRSVSWKYVLIDMIDYTQVSEEAALLLRFLLGGRAR